MVFILQRYIFRELFKVFILATIALTVMMSLGSILRPIQEYGVGAGQVLHLLGYFIPITLTFVLPLSGLFAAALVYGRFACDNELDACRASGISFLTLLSPGLTLAIIIAIANLVLSFYVVPDFFHRAESALKADAKQILFRNIQRKGFYSLPPDGEIRIFADRSDLVNNILEGVIVTEVEGGKITRTITTEKARIDFQMKKGQRTNTVQIDARDVYQIGGENETFFYFERFPVEREFASLLEDDIKFKKIYELKQIYNDPMLFYPVQEIAHDSFRQYACELLRQDIEKAVVDVNDFYHFRGDPNCAITLSDIKVDTKKDSQLELSGNIIALQYDGPGRKPIKTWRCSKALLRIQGEDVSRLKVVLELFGPKWKDSDGSEGIAAGRQFIRNLLLPDNVRLQLNSENVLETIEPQKVSAGLKKGASDKLIIFLNRLKKEISDIYIDITAELHTRLVFGIGCVPLIIIGIGLGVILRGGHLLSAFGASAIPAGLLIVCIMMGKNLAKNPGSGLLIGVLLMWAGFLILIGLALGLVYRLIKN